MQWVHFFLGRRMRDTAKHILHAVRIDVIMSKICQKCCAGCFPSNGGRVQINLDCILKD